MAIRFTVYEHTLTLETGELIARKFIVLKNEEDIIIGWTNFHRFIRSYKKRATHKITEDGGKRANYICLFLNFVFFGDYHIKSLTDIRFEMVRDFLQAYGNGTVGSAKRRRENTTVEACIRAIFDFIDAINDRYPDCGICTSDQLFKTVEVRDKKGLIRNKKVPNFEVNAESSPRKIFRDLPEKVFPIMMDHIITYHKNILMLVALSAFAGLRPSEACNVRREDSVLGAGIRFSIINGEIYDITVDITQELQLSCTCKNIGKIKKERVQRVYPAFRKVFYECYQAYMEYLEGKPYDAEYGPLSLNSRGDAMSYATYRNEFKKVVAELIPILKENPDPEVQFYAVQLEQNELGPHIMRHWFSSMLALFGEKEAGLQYWRGDSSPESALIYLQDKYDLTKQLAAVNAAAYDFNLWQATKEKEKEVLYVD